ncbi:MAG: hypothetical protein PWQ75_2616 [Methanolobus sp.]|uniref:NosD domain-containing protein n=1 Tax=Methanolobus sp. TaxID=1874737 RepID=UPI002589F3D3|nr:NosD domain-containing protein [Methanolobus sp.]MDK2832864.1 hypothetical protein [Methanolobus sp.]
MVYNKQQKTNTLCNNLQKSVATLFIFGIFMAVFVSSASAATLTVGPGETYTSISSAVTAVSSGDTILVKPGIYSEIVDLQYKTDVIIMSESANQVDTMVAGFDANYARNVTITGFNINGTLLGGSYGIYSYEGRNLTIEKNTISGYLTGNGIIIKNANYNLFADNTITNNKYGVYIDSSYYGTSSYNTITGNNISFNTDYGIVFNDMYISNNLFYNNYLMNRYNHFSASAVSIWNTTRSPGVNIIGGSYMGGNYWGRPDGTGFSQTHIDADADGICDEAYVYGADVDYFPLGGFAPIGDVSGLDESAVGTEWIVWNWTNPSDSMFNHSMVYLDGVFLTNTSEESFNATGLSDSTKYEIGIKTVDVLGNVKPIWVNDTATTLDGTAPASVIGLNESETGYTWINWSWTNPADLDFNHSIVYIDGTLLGITSTESFNATGLVQDTVYEIVIMTVDTSGNINSTSVKDTAKTDLQIVTPVTTSTGSSSKKSSGGSTGTSLRIISPEETSEDETVDKQNAGVADLEETPLQSTPEEPSDVGNEGAETGSTAGSLVENTESNSTPGFSILVGMVCMLSIVLIHRRKD